jgi:plasmid stabilization system protein ParE
MINEFVTARKVASVIGEACFMKGSPPMDLFERCGLLLEQIADRVAPGVLAEARSYGADGEWEAALITIGNTGVEVSPEEQDLLNHLLAELAEPPEYVAVRDLERQRELVVHPSHYQYYVRDFDCEYDPLVAPLEDDELVSVHMDRRLVQVHTGMYGFDLPLAVEILDAEPGADLAPWDEISEASAILTGRELLVESILTGRPADRFRLPAEPDQTRSYRVRVHATGRAEAAQAVHVSAENGDQLIERHLIQVWAAPVEPLKTWKP